MKNVRTYWGYAMGNKPYVLKGAWLCTKLFKMRAQAKVALELDSRLLNESGFLVQFEVIPVKESFKFNDKSKSKGRKT